MGSEKAADASVPLTEENVAEALQAIKDAPPQKKADIVQVFALRFDVAEELSPTSIDAITLSIPLLIGSPSPTLLTPVLLSLIPAQIKLISQSDSTSNKDRAKLMVQTLMSPLLEKMNDAKDRIHVPAVDNLIALGEVVFSNLKPTPDSSESALSSSAKGKEKETIQQMYERLLTNAMEGKSPRGKIGGTKIVTGVREKCTGLGLRPFMPLLVGYLEDGDSTVRESSRNALVALLSSPTTPLSARTELKKLMQSRSMKTTLIESLLDQINKAATLAATGSGRPSSAGAAGIRQRTISTKSAGVMDEVEIAPVYISTEREMESDFASFLPAFEGKETEHNWLQREKAISRVRGMLVTGVHRQFPSAFISVLRSSFLTASTKSLASLRTTLSVLTLGMYNDMLEELGTTFDPLVDSILPSLAKLAGATKKITAENSQNTIGLLIQKTSCPPRTFIPFLVNGINDKAPQVRGYFARHLRDYIEKPARGAAPAWTAEYLSSVSDMIKHCLGDGTPHVRETARQTFWAFDARCPKEAAKLMGELDDGVRKLLEKAKPAKKEPEKEQEIVQEVAEKPARPPAAAIKERKPVSSLMAEMKRKKMAAMKAQAAKNSIEDMLLPETDETPHTLSASSSIEGLPIKSPASSPAKSAVLPSGVTSPARTPTKATTASPSRIPIPVHTPHTPTSALATAAILPLPETPPISTPEGNLFSRSGAKLTSPREPNPDPFEDVFGSTPDRPIHSAADVSAAPESSVRQEEINRPETPSTIPVEADIPRSGLPSAQETSTSPVHPSLSRAGPSSRRIVSTARVPTSISGETQLEAKGESGRWSPAAQSLKTPSLTDCSIWIQWAKAATTGSPTQRTDLGPRLSSFRQGGSVDASLLEELSTLLASRAEIAGRNVCRVAQVEDIRQMILEQLADEEVPVTDLLDAVLKVVETLCRELNQNTQRSLLDAALLLFWEIVVRHQNIAENIDSQLVDGLFSLYQADEKEMRRPVAALLAIWGQTTAQPVDLLHLELTEVEKRLEAKAQDSWKILFFGAMSVVVLILRLPGAVVREQVEKMKFLVVAGMNAPNIAARQASSVLIVALQANIRDQVALFSMLSGLSDQQKDLAAYMIKQDLPEVEEGEILATSKTEGGLSKALRRLSTMRI